MSREQIAPILKRAQSATVRSQLVDSVRSQAGWKAGRPGSAVGNSMSMSKYLHDPETYLKIKNDKSAQYFLNTRVQTCSHIIRKNGKAVA